MFSALSVGFFNSGMIIALLSAGGTSAVTNIDALKRSVRNGDSSATQSFSNYVGIGPSVQCMVGAAEISRATCSLVVAPKVVIRLDAVDWMHGNGALEVDALMSSTFFSKKAAKSLGVRSVR